VRRRLVFQSFRRYKMQIAVNARLVNTPVTETVDAENDDLRIIHMLWQSRFLSFRLSRNRKDQLVDMGLKQLNILLRHRAWIPGILSQVADLHQFLLIGKGNRDHRGITISKIYVLIKIGKVNSDAESIAASDH
jgi:hypothetical protein